MSRTIELQEHKTRDFELTAEEVAGLERSRLRLTVKPKRAGVYTVGAHKYVGTDVVGHLTINVVPKLAISRLLYVLGVYPEGFETTAWTRLCEEAGSVRALSKLYTASLDGVLSHGLPTGYRRRVDDLQSVRGALDALHLATVRYGLFPPLRCQFDEHTPDIEANRRLLAAARALVMSPDCDRDARKSLRAHSEHLAKLVETRRYGPEVEPLTLDSLIELQLGHGARQYRAAVDIATVVLRHGTVEWKGEHVGSLSFVVNMDEAYEKFVCRSLGRLLEPLSERWREEPCHHLDHGSHCQTFPDAVWYDSEGEPRMVIDAKWKRTERGKSEDIKQLFVYCTALGLSRGVLVYGEANRGVVHRIRNSQVEIYVLSLPLDGTIVDVDSRVKALAESIASLAAGSLEVALRSA